MPASAFQFPVDNGRIRAIYVQRNPEKLRGIDAALQNNSLPRA